MTMMRRDATNCRFFCSRVMYFVRLRNCVGIFRAECVLLKINSGKKFLNICILYIVCCNLFIVTDVLNVSEELLKCGNEKLDVTVCQFVELYLQM